MKHCSPTENLGPKYPHSDFQRAWPHKGRIRCLKAKQRHLVSYVDKSTATSLLKPAEQRRPCTTVCFTPTCWCLVSWPLLLVYEVCWNKSLQQVPEHYRLQTTTRYTADCSQQYSASYSAWPVQGLKTLDRPVYKLPYRKQTHGIENVQSDSFKESWTSLKALSRIPYEQNTTQQVAKKCLAYPIIIDCLQR